MSGGLVYLLGDVQEGLEMTHQRIRRFNTKDSHHEQNLDDDLCPAVATKGGRTVWMRGQRLQILDDAKNIESHSPAE